MFLATGGAGAATYGSTGVSSITIDAFGRVTGVATPAAAYLNTASYVAFSAFTGVVTGTRFDDVNNTAYYIDPLSTSVVNRINSTYLYGYNGAASCLELAGTGVNEFGTLAQFRTDTNGTGTQNGPRAWLVKGGAKSWSIGIESGSNNGWVVWEDGTNSAVGTPRFTIASGGAITANGNFNLNFNLTAGVSSQVINGFSVSSYNNGTVSSGTFTPSPFLGNYQYYTNGGAHTLAAPASNCAIDILVINSSTAGSIAFSGFTVQTGGTGDSYATTNGNRYILMIRRINNISTYIWKALQ